ncbi:hypothetical protein Leryth_021545 [Lithospermum erythrorhizon]|nr:hypothetical protein Leryth_021545 [Lithospermum erythrorhizon]
MRWGIKLSAFSTMPPSSSLMSSISSCRAKGLLLDSEKASSSSVIYLGIKSACSATLRTQTSSSTPEMLDNFFLNEAQMEIASGSASVRHNFKGHEIKMSSEQVKLLRPSMHGIKASHFCLLMKNIDMLEHQLSDLDVIRLEREILVHIERLGALSLFHECLSRTRKPDSVELPESYVDAREDTHASCPVDRNLRKFVPSLRKKKKKSRTRCSQESYIKSSQSFSESILKDMKTSMVARQRKCSKSGIYRLRVARSEGEMSRGVKLLNDLERIKEELEASGQVVSLSSWSQAARVDNKVLQELLHFGWSCRDQLLKSTRSLVIYLARNYRGSGVAFEDLIQAGYSGVLQGAERFDDTRGYKFSTYVQYWIRKSMSTLVSQHARGIRIPMTLSSAIKKIQKARKALSSSHGKCVSDSDIAEYTGLSIGKISSASKCLRVVGSLDQKIGDPSSSKYTELTPDLSIPTPEKAVMRDHMKNDVYKLLNCLEPRERQVLIMRFGIGNHQRKSLEETGKHFSVSKEWIRKIERTALEKLRNEDSLHNLKHYVYI